MAPPRVPLEERFAKWTRKTETGCWEWLGKIDWAGYGHIKHEGRDRKAATVAYEFFKGPIPKGLEISHTCEQVWCVNPDHLIVETHAENLKRRRGFDRRTYKGLCKRGHVLPSAEERNKNLACPICYAAGQAKWKAENLGYNSEYRERNKDRINANRRASRARARRDGRRVT